MDGQIITAICAVVISVCSLIVSVISLWRQRQHDRKSVLPIPQIILADYEDRLSVAIENAGVGPLVIQGLDVTHSLSNEVKPSVIAHMPDLPSRYFWSTFAEKVEGRAISAQNRLVLLELVRPDSIEEKFDQTFDQVRNAIRTQLGYLTISVSVADIYGAKLPICIRHLDWFHRLLFGGPNKAIKRADHIQDQN